MKDQKRSFRFFTVPEWEKEQDYLRNEHKKGWKFRHVNLLGMSSFDRCEPEDVVYQLDFNPDGIKNKSEYIQMFSDCGWEYIQDYVGYSYFRKPVSQMSSEDEGIFCDENSRIDMIKRVFKGRVIPLLCIFFIVIIPNMFLQNGIREMMTVLFVLYVVILTSFGVQFWKLIYKHK